VEAEPLDPDVAGRDQVGEAVGGAPRPGEVPAGDLVDRHRPEPRQVREDGQVALGQLDRACSSPCGRD
jgi:hypothetical protein